MTIQECYKRLGGDYEDVFSRLLSEERVIKFVLRFLDDTSYQQICDRIAANDMEEAFRAAHTLKGITQNFSFTSLYNSSHELTEALRPGAVHETEPDIQALLADVTRDYKQVVDAIQSFKNEM